MCSVIFFKNSSLCWLNQCLFNKTLFINSLGINCPYILILQPINNCQDLSSSVRLVLVLLIPILAPSRYKYLLKADTNTCSKPIPILAPSRYHTDSTTDNETNIFPELILCQLLVKIYRYLPKVLPICKSLTNIYTIPSMYLSDNQYTYPQQIYWLAYIKFPETGISVSTKFIGM